MEAVIVLPSTRKVEVLNEIGARIWSLLDGNRSVRQIIEMISSEYDVELETARIDTLEFLGVLYEKGIVEIGMTPDRG